MSAGDADRSAEALRRVAEAALLAYDLDVTSVSLITNDWNGVFRVDLRDGDRRVVRVSLPDSARALRSTPRCAGSTRWRGTPR